MNYTEARRIVTINERESYPDMSEDEAVAHARRTISLDSLIEPETRLDTEDWECWQAYRIVLGGETMYPEIEVKLLGEDGNGFMIVGRVRRALERARVPGHIVDEFTEEATSGDYDHLLQTAMRWVEVT